MNARHLLAGLIVGAGTALAASQAAAVVVNGDFEDTSSSTPGAGLYFGAALSDLASGPGPSWDIYTSIPGWTTIDGAGVEVQTNRTLSAIDAHSGEHYIELDSHPSPQSNSTIAQDIVLTHGSYRLDFYYSPRTRDAGSNGVAYAINGGDLAFGGVTGPSAANGTSVGEWTLISALFSVGPGDSPITLTFAATGAQNTLGGFIDDVSISAIPVPAALPLFLTALAGLGYVSRRRRAD